MESSQENLRKRVNNKMVFLLIIIIFIGWITLINYEQQQEKQRVIKREKYWASPEGKKERQQQIENGEKARKWLDAIASARSFKKRHQWCWSCKASIKLNIDVSEPILHGGKEEEEAFNKELFRIVCSGCGWIICDKCKACGCNTSYRFKEASTTNITGSYTSSSDSYYDDIERKGLSESHWDDYDEDGMAHEDKW